jgi:hypothetical protein
MRAPVCAITLEAEIPNKTKRTMLEKIAPEKILEIYFVFISFTSVFNAISGEILTNNCFCNYELVYTI